MDKGRPSGSNEPRVFGHRACSTHLFSLRARGALGARETAVTLFSLFARRSDEPDQAWVTLWE